MQISLRNAGKDIESFLMALNLGIFEDIDLRPHLVKSFNKETRKKYFLFKLKNNENIKILVYESVDKEQKQENRVKLDFELWALDNLISKSTEFVNKTQEKDQTPIVLSTDNKIFEDLSFSNRIGVFKLIIETIDNTEDIRKQEIENFKKINTLMGDALHPRKQCASKESASNKEQINNFVVLLNKCKNSFNDFRKGFLAENAETNQNIKP